MTPGVSSAKSMKLRPLTGRFCTATSSTVELTCVRPVSMTGVAPSTTTFSATLASGISIRRVSVWPIVSANRRLSARREARELRRDVVGARRQQRCAEQALLVGDHRARCPCRGLRDRDRHAREHRAGLIDHLPFDRGGCALGGRHRRQDRAQRDRRHDRQRMADEAGKHVKPPEGSRRGKSRSMRGPRMMPTRLGAPTRA